jgi:hypothetical protein
MAHRSSERKSGSVGIAEHVELRRLPTMAIGARKLSSCEIDTAWRPQMDDVATEPNRAA